MIDYQSWGCVCGHVNPVARDVCASCRKDRIDVEVEKIRSDGQSEFSLAEMVKRRLLGGDR